MVPRALLARHAQEKRELRAPALQSCWRSRKQDILPSAFWFLISDFALPANLQSTIVRPRF